MPPKRELPIDRPGFSGKPWPQYDYEVEKFLKLLHRHDVTSYMEVGCRYGDTVHFIGRNLPLGSNILAVDLPGAKSGIKNKGGHQDSGQYLQRAIYDLRSLGQSANMILADSQDPVTVARVQEYAPFDAVLIDGDHTAEGVTKDLANYGPMARIVAFHDISGGGKWARQIRPIFEAFAKTCKESHKIEFDGKRRGIGVCIK